MYIKAGKRPPQRQRSRRSGRWSVLALALSTIAVLALLVMPEAPQIPSAAGPSAVSAPGLGAAIPRASAASGGAPALTPSLAEIARRPLDAAVFPVGVRRIVIDPGHGGKDVGTVTSDGRYEKDVALDIALRLRDLLRQADGVEVMLTRERDEEVLLRDRARFANEARADLFVSIHLNSLGTAATRGVETFYLGPTEDPELVQLASRENLESGYSLGDVRRLLDGIYLDLRGKESRQLAGDVQRSLVRSLAEQGSGPLRNRGVKSAPFLVLVATEMPAVLAEVSSLSNQKDAELLAGESYRQGIADALRIGIEAYTLRLSQQPSTAEGAPASAPASTSAVRKGTKT